ncbi:MAG: hypothetical protein KME17_08830 [Cyanosarcina radialis HA8281-LM2]|jgi:predicted membrane GTPase involved in stress response|nr:hypothetical protein [Cyanosarcina radialis HA8281-LM2]
MEVEEAILKLSRFGLVAKFIGGEDRRIMGGTEVTREREIVVYHHSFAIYRENTDWIAAVCGPGQFDTISEVKSLEEAVDEVCRIYRDRRSKGELYSLRITAKF